jgi:hypothetical protein
MSTLSDDEYTLLLSLPSLASQILNPSTQSLQDTILGNDCEQPPDSDHEFSQSQPTIPASAVLASLLESIPAKMSTQFNVSGRPIAGTPMASILSFCQAHQQMHLPGC